MNLSHKIACAALGLISLLAPARAAAAPEHPLRPLLWKVEGKELTEPSYLFGTIHLSRGPAAKLHPAARKAFEESASLHTEVPMDLASQMAALPLMMRADGKSLGEAIGDDLSAQLDAEFKLINPALDSTPFQPMKTWVAALLPKILPEQLGGGKPLDLQLWEEASRADKKTAGMEKTEDQTAAFNELTEPEQVILLRETLKILQKERAEGKDSTKTLTDAYLTGDPEKVVAEIDRALQEMAEGEHAELGKKLMKRLLDDRDKIMADYIVTVLKKEPATRHFFAAGAGHFCSEKSIRYHLAEAGYTVTRIEE
jgi:uncharacterized protein